jgi:MATE family multidrug resistance protein
MSNLLHISRVLTDNRLVWGPAPVRLGYIGAPISTAISFNLISICTIIYAVFFAPREAWHPLTTKSFKSLGVLVQLGLAGVGQLASEWWSWELLGRESLASIVFSVEVFLCDRLMAPAVIVHFRSVAASL